MNKLKRYFKKLKHIYIYILALFIRSWVVTSHWPWWPLHSSPWRRRTTAASAAARWRPLTCCTWAPPWGCPWCRGTDLRPSAPAARPCGHRSVSCPTNSKNIITCGHRSASCPTNIKNIITCGHRSVSCPTSSKNIYKIYFKPEKRRKLQSRDQNSMWLKILSVQKICLEWMKCFI